MKDWRKWAVVGNVVTCLYVGAVFLITDSLWSFSLLVTLTVIKNIRQ